MTFWPTFDRNRGGDRVASGVVLQGDIVGTAIIRRCLGDSQLSGISHNINLDSIVCDWTIDNNG